MKEKRRKYTREFKIEAVKMVTKGGYGLSQVARDLGITTGMLARWRKQLGDDPRYAFPWQGASERVGGGSQTP